MDTLTNCIIAFSAGVTVMFLLMQGFALFEQKRNARRVCRESSRILREFNNHEGK